MGRKNYITDMIDKTNQARRDYQNDPENKTKKQTLEELDAAKNRALDAPSAGAGRGNTAYYSQSVTERRSRYNAEKKAGANVGSFSEWDAKE